MSTCARCGLEQGEWTEADKCSAHVDENSSGVIDCRNRELANLRSLLRSVTLQLEEAGNTVQEAREMLDGADRAQCEVQRVLKRAEGEIDQVLEALL